MEKEEAKFKKKGLEIEEHRLRRRSSGLRGWECCKLATVELTTEEEKVRSEPKGGSRQNRVDTHTQS